MFHLEHDNDVFSYDTIGNTKYYNLQLNTDIDLNIRHCEFNIVKRVLNIVILMKKHEKWK